jgi:hypothetical protein
MNMVSHVLYFIMVYLCLKELVHDRREPELWAT